MCFPTNQTLCNMTPYVVNYSNRSIYSQANCIKFTRERDAKYLIGTGKYFMTPNNVDSILLEKFS